jgi:glycosyltransferase involved in cell wall biosynthesis
MNICMIGYTNYLLDTRVRREAETLAELPEYTVRILALKNSNLSPKTYSHAGVSVQELNMQKYQGRSNLQYILSYLKFMFLAFLACNSLLSKKSLDIVHIHNMPNFIIFSAILPILRGKKVVLDIHDTMIETYASKFNGKLKKLFGLVLRLEEYICCSLADRIVCVNHLQRAALVKRRIPINKIMISMNVPDPKRIDGNVVLRRDQKEESFNLVYFGTIANRLGIDLAIRAVAKIKGNIPSLKLYIFGEGDDLEQCIQLSGSLGMRGTVVFEKAMPFEKLVVRLKEMDMLVIPNRKNCATELMLPAKMLDGVALGIPVIAPKLSAIQHYFSDEMIFFFQPDNVDSMADAILHAYNNETERIDRAENAKLFFERYGWERHKGDLINLYRSLLSPETT